MTEVSNGSSLTLGMFSPGLVHLFQDSQPLCGGRIERTPVEVSVRQMVGFALPVCAKCMARERAEDLLTNLLSLDSRLGSSVDSGLRVWVDGESPGLAHELTPGTTDPRCGVTRDGGHIIPAYYAPVLGYRACHWCASVR